MTFDLCDRDRFQTPNVNHTLNNGKKISIFNQRHRLRQGSMIQQPTNGPDHIEIINTKMTRPKGMQRKVVVSGEKNTPHWTRARVTSEPLALLSAAQRLQCVSGTHDTHKLPLPKLVPALRHGQPTLRRTKRPWSIMDRRGSSVWRSASSRCVVKSCVPAVFQGSG